MVVELQLKILGTFSNITQKVTELNNNIFDNSNISIEAINNINSHKPLFFLVSILNFENVLLVAISS